MFNKKVSFSKKILFSKKVSFVLRSCLQAPMCASCVPLCAYVSGPLRNKVSGPLRNKGGGPLRKWTIKELSLLIEHLYRVHVLGYMCSDGSG